MGDEDDDLIEIMRKLNQLAAEASPEERERAFEIMSANGDYLMMKFGLCMKRIRARPDLAPDTEAKAIEDTATFLALFDKLQKWPREYATDAFDLAMVTLHTGLRVGVGPEEAEKILREAYSAGAHTYGNRPKSIPWRRYVEALALENQEKMCGHSDTWFANQLVGVENSGARKWKKKPAEWEEEIPNCPSHGMLRKFIGELRPKICPPSRNKNTDGDDT
jgi:hypothetical protein